MKFNNYEVLCREDGSIYRLGQGPTSSSYKALDIDLRTPVVLKVMRTELFADETARKRFMREARAAALLRHPNVAQIYRMGEEHGSCFYAREFIEGETLEARVNREGPLETAEALKVALQVAEALVAVKEAHLVHRDIKPSNLMMTPRGEVKIIDFGLAKSNPNGQIDGIGQITMNGFVGSSDYASPEQLNEEPLEVTSDIYSLGITLWFLLTGRRPFRGAQARVMAAHLNDAPPLVLRLVGRWDQPFSASGFWYSVVTGLCVGAGTVAFFLLFQRGGPLSVVPAILAGGAAMMAVAGIALFHEPASWQHLLGVALALAGLFLLRN